MIDIFLLFWYFVKKFLYIKFHTFPCCVTLTGRVPFVLSHLLLCILLSLVSFRKIQMVKTMAMMMIEFEPSEWSEKVV